MIPDYNKLYKNYYNIGFGEEYVIHHIDENRKNNNISNLILLPRELHAEYHTCGSRHIFELEIYGKSLFFDTLHGFNNLKEYYILAEKLKPWIAFKESLDIAKLSNTQLSSCLLYEFPRGIVEICANDY